MNDVLFGGVSSYEGTVDIGGIIMPVTFVTLFGANQYLIYNPGPASVTFPASLPTITPQTYSFCFAKGTLISTPEGERTVEALTIGDMIETAEGKPVAVKWIGRQTVFPAFLPAARLGLVRVDAGALGPGCPARSLTLTADHALLIEGVLCHAGALVNGTTITQVPLSEMGNSYTVYHIETEAHEIILANGAPAETFIDNVSRRAFDNFPEFEALYGEVPEMEELPYPRAMSARQVPARILTWISRASAA
ncbi:Hint domain-containing protein [Nioella ostreopsis]|uniref:Hint domain-containing protein n=1 Tax=Nioella ostreopsis TaxID=2448479 RepID=UPI0013DEA930|nr:Hint domain-containing protein [Nioella ostreopsis]